MERNRRKIFKDFIKSLCKWRKNYENAAVVFCQHSRSPETRQQQQTQNFMKRTRRITKNQYLSIFAQHFVWCETRWNMQWSWSWKIIPCTIKSSLNAAWWLIDCDNRLRRLNMCYETCFLICLVVFLSPSFSSSNFFQYTRRNSNQMDWRETLTWIWMCWTHIVFRWKCASCKSHIHRQLLWDRDD